MNKVILIGNLGHDPEVSATPGGVSVCKFSVATTSRWTDDKGEKHEETEWHNVVAWRKAAEILGQYLKKGSKVAIVGKMKTRSWDDKDTGKKRYSTEVIVDEFEFLGDAKGKEGGAEGGAGNNNATAKPARAAAKPDDDPLPF